MAKPTPEEIIESALMMARAILDSNEAGFARYKAAGINVWDVKANNWYVLLEA